MSVIINKSTNDKVVVNKTATETVKVATGIKGDVGATGPVGPIGPVGDPGVHVGPTPPADTDLLWVDTSSTLSGTGGQSIYGLADPSNYLNVPAEMLDLGNSTTGWIVVNAVSSLTVDSSFGVGNEAITVQLSAGTGNSLINSKVYKNFSPIDMSNRVTLSFETTRDFLLGPSSNPSQFVVVAATGNNLTGTLFTAPYPDGAELAWTKAYVDVPLGTTIRSIGIKSTTLGQGGTNRIQFWIRNLQVEPVSNVQAAQLVGKTPVVTEATAVGTTGHISPVNLTPKLDLRRDSAVVPGLGGWWDLREWGVPEDGVTDTTSYINNVLADLPEGARLKFPTGGVFRLDGTISISRPVTIDFNGSILYTPFRRPKTQLSNDFIQISGYVTDVNILNGNIFATRYTPINAGGVITVLAGNVVTSGSISVLNSVGDSGQYIPTDQYVRWLGRHYEPGFGIVNRFDTTLSGDGLSSVQVEIVTQSGEVLATQSIVPPVAPQSYTLRCNPPDLSKRLFIRYTKSGGTSPINIHTITPWGINTYSSAYEFATGITVQNASRVLVENWWIEGVGGYGTFVQSFDKSLGHVTFKNVTSRCGNTQNHAPVTGRYITYESCNSYESGRTGFDCEPYGTGWALDHITLNNCTSRNDRNYALSTANWGLISNLNVNNFKAIDWGFGAFIGGSRGGRISGFTSSSTISSNSDMSISAKDMLITNLELGNGLQVVPSVWTLDGNYTAGGNMISNFVISNMRSVGNDYSAAIEIQDGSSTISGGTYPSETPTTPGTNALSYGAVANITGRSPMFGFDVGRWRKVMPKTFKGLAMDGTWWPYGLDSSDALVSTRGLSATARRPQNFRGIAAPVATGVQSATVTFPQKSGFANLTSVQFAASPYLYTGTKPTTLTTGTSYYYAICGIVDYDDWGHRPAVRTATGAALTSTNRVYIMGVQGRLDWSNQTSIAGYAIYRGTGGSASSGPWTARYIVRPTGPWFSSRNDLTQVIDTGDSLVTSYAAAADREWGYPNMNVADGVLATAEYGSWSLIEGPFSDTTGYEWDTSYSIQITPSWVTTVAVVAKRQSGFDVEFGTPAPAGATFDWVLIR
jgi:hypothetical protein